MLITRILPTIADLVARAAADPEFLADISRDHADLVYVAANAIDAAADAWEEEYGERAGTMPLALLMNARAPLIDRAHDILDARDSAAALACADSVMAGDVDSHGEPIGYPTYRVAA